MKKTRADSKIESFPPAARAALDQWLFADNVGYAECAARLRSQFSCAVGINALSTYFQRRAQQQMLDRIVSGRAMAEGLQADLRATAPLLEESTLQLISQKAFELAVSTQPDINSLSSLTTLLLKARKQAMDEKSLALDLEKWRFDAAQACLAKLPELKAIAERPKLTPDEKAEAIQQILFPS